MYWADELAAAVAGPQVVNDSKSPSGTVHVGSLRGVVLHDAIHRALLGAGLEARFLYGVDDMDAMDSQALLTPDTADRVRSIYLRVSHVDRPNIWLPIQVICENCGKIGTTYATDWDGSTVAYLSLIHI